MAKYPSSSVILCSSSACSMATTVPHRAGRRAATVPCSQMSNGSERPCRQSYEPDHEDQYPRSAGGSTGIVAYWSGAEESGAPERPGVFIEGFEFRMKAQVGTSPGAILRRS